MDPSTEPQEITILVAEIMGQRVKLAFEADKQSVKILRAELAEDHAVVDEIPDLPLGRVDGVTTDLIRS